MLTWRLWHMLRHPPHDHPLFRRITRPAATSNKLVQAAKVLVVYLAVCIGLTLIWPLLVSETFLALGLLAVGFNTVYALVWAMTISATIAYEHEQNTYILLSLLPTGSAGINWVLSTARLHSTSLFHNLRVLLRIVAVALIGALLMSMMLPLLVMLTPGQPELFDLFQTLISGLLLALAFYCDHIQSLVLASLLGMLTPIYAQNRLNAQLVATLGFLLLQICVYLMTFIIGFVLLPSAPGFAIIRLGIFYGLREGLLIGVWRLLNHSLS